MTANRSRLTLQHRPKPGTVDAAVLGYLSETADDLPALVENFTLAVSAFWLPHSYKQANASPEVLVETALNAECQIAEHCQYLEAACGGSDLGSPLGLHLYQPPTNEALGQLSLPASPNKFVIAVTDTRNLNLSHLALFLSGISRRERLLKILQPLRAFWFPLACKHYGLEGESLARAGRASVDLLRVRIQNHRAQFCPDLPPTPETAVQIAFAPSAADEVSEETVPVPAHNGNGNGQPPETIDRRAMFDSMI